MLTPFWNPSNVYVDFVIFNRVSLLIVFVNLTPKSAAYSSNRGIDNILIGATFTFATMIRIFGTPPVVLLAYTTAPKAFSDASTKVCS